MPIIFSPGPVGGSMAGAERNWITVGVGVRSILTDVGIKVGVDVGTSVGVDVGTLVGIKVGIAVGVSVGVDVGTMVGVRVEVGVGIEAWVNNVGVDVGISFVAGKSTVTVAGIAVNSTFSLAWSAEVTDKICVSGAGSKVILESVGVVVAIALSRRIAILVFVTMALVESAPIDKDKVAFPVSYLASSTMVVIVFDVSGFGVKLSATVANFEESKLTDNFTKEAWFTEVPSPGSRMIAKVKISPAFTFAGVGSKERMVDATTLLDVCCCFWRKYTRKGIATRAIIIKTSSDIFLYDEKTDIKIL
jgi:hypothetical protein